VPNQFNLPQPLIRFLATWRELIVGPSRFVRTQPDVKRRSYSAPWPFFLANLTILSVANSALIYGLEWVQDPEAPLPKFFSYVSPPGKLDALVLAAEVGLSCFYYFLVVRNLFGVKMQVSTGSPFRRLFDELLYFEAGPASLVSFGAVLLLVPTTWAAMTFVFGPLDPSLNLNNGEDWGVWEVLWMVGVAGVLLSFVLVPMMIVVGYTYAFARGMFVLRRIPALALAFWPAVGIPAIYTCAVLFFVVVHPQELSFVDRDVVGYLRAVARIERAYEQQKHRYCDLESLLTYAGSITELQAAFGGYSAELKVLKETLPDSLSHRLIFQLTKRSGYVHALPKAGLDPGVRSYLVSFKDSAVRTCECGGQQADLFQPPVTTF